MTRHPLDAATILNHRGDDLFAGHTSEDYWAFVGPFGGASSALLLRAVIEHPQCLGTPLALTVNFCAPLAKGEFTVSARPARTNRSTQHWSLELVQNGDVILTGSAVTAERRDSWSHQPARMPVVAPGQEIDRYRMGRQGPAWVDRYEFRFASGGPTIGRPIQSEPHPSLSHVWLRDDPPRPLDHLALASLADAFFGRVFHARGEIVPFGTVSLTTYFLGSAEEIARQGERLLLGVADTKRYHRSYLEQSIELWADDGALLASGVQVAYFKA